MKRPRLLLVVPRDDLSINLFFSESYQAGMAVKSSLYQKAPTLIDEGWDFIYIRGPFIKADFDNQEIKDSIEQILQLRGSAYVVDGIHNFSDLLLEDKWRQYGLLADLMPDTKLLDSFKGINLKNQLIKKRISGRSRDIHFDTTSLSDNAVPRDYIVQSRLDIETEYRAFMAGGKLVLPLEIKTSKTETTNNKAIAIEPKAPKEVDDICHRVSAKLKFDLVGLDIAKTKDSFYLLEVNRSPQFSGYLRLTRVNLAESLIRFLLSKQPI